MTLIELVGGEFDGQRMEVKPPLAGRTLTVVSAPELLEDGTLLVEPRVFRYRVRFVRADDDLFGIPTYLWVLSEDGQAVLFDVVPNEELNRFQPPEVTG